MTKMKLMVLIPSYNKEQYIKESIDSVLNQKTDFDFQIVVTDDGSKDNTVNIVKSYIKKYKDKIKLLPSATNKGLLTNIIKAYKYMKCDYFCVLDPDDYYTDDLFLQKAVNFLDKNKQYNIYASDVNVLDINKKIHRQNGHIKTDSVDSTFQDMLEGKAVLGHTVSSVFRNVVIDNKLIERLKEYIGNFYSEHSVREDDFRNRIHLHNSNAHYVNEVVGVYRSTNTGLFQGSNSLRKILMKIQACIDMYYFFDNKYPEFINMALHSLNRIETEALQSDMNNLSDYDVRDIMQLCKIINELGTHDAGYVDGVIKKFNTKHKRFKRTCRNIFSIDKLGFDHTLIRILGLKIESKRK